MKPRAQEEKGLIGMPIGLTGFNPAQRASDVWERGGASI
jgi:hypothetical protein